MPRVVLSRAPPVPLTLLPAKLFSIVGDYVYQGNHKKSIHVLSKTCHDTHDKLVDWTYETVVKRVRSGKKAGVEWARFCGSVKAQAVDFGYYSIQSGGTFG